MVSTKLRTVQWAGVHSANCTDVDTDRCLNKGLGDKVQWNLNSGIWSAHEMKNHLNVLELLFWG